MPILATCICIAFGHVTYHRNYIYCWPGYCPEPGPEFDNEIIYAHYDSAVYQYEDELAYTYPGI